MAIDWKGIVALLLVCCCWDSADVRSSEPTFKVIAKRSNDSVKVSTKEGATIVSVRSPFGISSATIQRNDERWPERMILRLHLEGLESLKISSKRLELVSESSADNGRRVLRLSKTSDQSKPIELSESPKNEIRSLDADGKPSAVVPLKGGYLEALLPKALFLDNPELITIQWIDFYR